MGVRSSLQAIQSITDPARSHWKVVLSSGKELAEDKLVLDFRKGGYRTIDWALDLNTTGDLFKIKELWLLCPNNQQAMLKIDEPGTAFQFKHGSLDTSGSKFVEAQCIGKVTDKDTGACDTWIWDRVLGLIQYTSNINNFGAWRDGLMPLTQLSRDVIGLRL